MSAGNGAQNELARIMNQMDGDVAKQKGVKYPGAAAKKMGRVTVTPAPLRDAQVLDLLKKEARQRGLQPPKEAKAFHLGGRGSAILAFYPHTGARLVVTHRARKPLMEEVVQVRAQIVPPQVTMVFMCPPQPGMADLLHPYAVSLWELEGLVNAKLRDRAKQSGSPLINPHTQRPFGEEAP